MKWLPVIVMFGITSLYSPASYDNWLLHARISTPYGYNLSWEEGIARAVNNGVNVILDWANFSDTYEGRILNFKKSLEEFRQHAEYVHSHYPGIKYMVYFAPFEMQTLDSDMNRDGRDDDGKNSTYTDHPEWLQMGIDGRRAVFYGSMPGIPFWVGETDEDAWLSPSNREYRNIIINEAKEIAKYADAIWFDVPHLCFDFGKGWQKQWSSIDNASRMDFERYTGLHFPPPPINPDWNNETWLKFVEWRYKQVVDFIRDFYTAVKEGNPDCKLVIETSSYGPFITQHACDIYMLPDVSDVVAHEYGGPFYEVQYYAWLEMIAQLKQWYDFGRNEAVWLLSYVEYGKTQLAKFHACIVSMMGFNYYTSGDIGMTGIVDEKFMRNFFKWMEEYDDYFYGWKSNADIGVVFSRPTLDYLDRGSWNGYAYYDEFMGTLMMLVESNIPFRVIDARDLESINNFDFLILPDFACMNDSQAEEIREYVKNGGKLISINDTSLYTQYGEKRNNFLLADVFGIDSVNATDDTIYENSYGNGKSIFIKTPLGRYFYWAAQPWSNNSHKIEAEKIREEFLQLLEKCRYSPPYVIEGNAIAMPYENGDEKSLRIINFKGIKYGDSKPEKNMIKVMIRGDIENVSLLNFMGGVHEINAKREGNYSIISFEIENGCSIFYNTKNEIYVTLVKPSSGGVYIVDRKMLSLPIEKSIIIGPITIEAITNGKEVKFYVDDVLKYTDKTRPYSWKLNERLVGLHKIKVSSDGVSDEIDMLILNS